MAFARPACAHIALATKLGAGALLLVQAAATDATPTAAPCKPKDAWDGHDYCPFQGFLPLFPDFEQSLPNWPIRLPLYLAGLAWTFLGIAIISDIFMAGIEKVTSWKKRVKDKKTGRTVTVYVWNATVANLTLMALGSSAPEILLSLIEIVQNDMFLGDLGAGTIVGSAAFNLLIISAVCVVAIPEPEVRYIKQTTVYAITATCSVLAYVWLMFILMVFSPNVCTITEAVATLLFCPALVVAAYFADKGYFDRVRDKDKEPLQTIPDDVTNDELAQIEQQIRETYGMDLNNDQIVHIMSEKYFTQRSRAYYRRAAMRMGARMSLADFAKASKAPPDQAVSLAVTTDSLPRDKKEQEVVIGFETARYAFLESCGTAPVKVVRTGPTDCKATVHYKTRDGTAKRKDDYEPAEGTIVFEKGESEKTLQLKIHNDNAYEDNEEFYVDLSEPSDDRGSEGPEKSSGECRLSEISTVIIVIIDDDDPGTIKFKTEEVEVLEGVEGTMAQILVERLGGASGNISFKYETEDMTAVGGMDYEPASGEVELAPAVQSTVIQVAIKPRGRYIEKSSFIVRLSEPTSCVFDKETDGGEEFCICNVTIKGNTNEHRTHLLNRMESKINSQQTILGHRHWRQQFYDAVFTVLDDDDEDEEDDGTEKGSPTKMDYFIHVASMPWKILFAFVPPVDYCGGWLTFFGALAMIAVVTAIVGDIANLVGCCMKIVPEITAITFVALGTSLPDTFASKAAACMDPYADASIGNITGSNSVNVFIGLGLSWTIAAIYWETRTPTQEWVDRLTKPTGLYFDIKDSVAEQVSGDKAVFVTPAGTLWFNLLVFSCNAIFALQHLYARRRKFGGELGGPRKGMFGQYFSACFLLSQWVIYVGLSSIWATINAASC